MPRGIVVFGEDWGAHPSSTQHLVARLARDRDVIWVNSIGLRRPRLDRRDLGRVVAKLKGAARSRPPNAATAPPLGGRMTIVEPRAVSWPGSRAARLFNKLSLGAQLRGALARRSMRNPILWASLPSAVSVVGELGESAVVYYCGDDFGALAGVDHGAARTMERELVERAGLVLAASAELAARFPRQRVALAPHGVDFELFSTPAPRAADLPLGRPVAGFYGSLAEWIDVEMLAQAARALPDWTFALIGEVRADTGPLAGLANVALLGPRPHRELPSYAQHWDVSLLPFRDTAQIRACNPLKLREYLAAGAPVAATDFPALEGYRAHIEVARGASDFAGAILRARQGQANVAARRASVAGESWDARALFVSQLLERA